MELKSQYEEIQQMRSKFNHSPNANNMVEHDEIEKWAERFQSLNKTACRWKERNSSFENSMVELEANISFRAQKTSDKEAHIDFLKLKLEFEDQMNDHKVKVASWRRKNDVQKQLQEEFSKRFQVHRKKMENRQTTFLSRFKHTKEELKKAEDRRKSHFNTGNQNIECLFKNIEHKHNNVEESGNRIEADRAEIILLESELAALKSEINLKCKEEISYSPNEMFIMEHTSKIGGLCTKLDQWNEEYERLEIEHDKWMEMKKQLEVRMKSTEQNIDVLEKQLSKLNDSIICLNRMIDTDEKIKDLREMTIEYKDLQVQKRDADRMCDAYTEKMVEYNKNNDRLSCIREKLQNMTEPAKRRNWPSILFQYPNGRIVSSDSSWRSFKRVVDSDLLRIDNFGREKIETTKKLSDYQFELIGESKLRLCDANKRIESCITEIEKKYEEVKQRNEKLSSPDNTGYVGEYLDKIKYLI